MPHPDEYLNEHLSEAISKCLLSLTIRSSICLGECAVLLIICLPAVLGFHKWDDDR